MQTANSSSLDLFASSPSSVQLHQQQQQQHVHASESLASINSANLKSPSDAQVSDDQHLRPGAVIGASSVWSGAAAEFALVAAATTCELLTLSAAHLALVLSSIPKSDALAVGVGASEYLARSSDADDKASGMELIQSLLTRFGLDHHQDGGEDPEISASLEQLNCARTELAGAAFSQLLKHK